MRKLLFTVIVLFTFLQYAWAQGTVEYRVILIGDAGEINIEQKAVLLDAVQKNIAGKTIALFLGDNIYPTGMEFPGTKTAQGSQDILRSQYEGLRKAGVPVYFIPGNHDWDKSGPKGYEKIILANQFLRQQNDSLLQMIPADACPGPYELVVSERLVVVAMDSEWWLYPFSKKTEGDDCECKTKRDVLGKLNDIIRRNKNKTILFATHHPFTTYGPHGGYYNLKDHLFPLTNLNKNLYIPLPVIGSLYPMLRTTFPPAEDVKNVLYQDMKMNVEEILKLHPNIIHVAGHEHALQLIYGAVPQLVSGAGSKHTPVKKGRGSVYAKSLSGYVIADFFSDNSISLSFQTYHNGIVENDTVYTIRHTDPLMAIEPAGMEISGDSIKIKLNSDFDKVSKVHRGLFGENYRKVWAMETTIPILRISEAHLVPKELGGGMQTRSLRLMEGKKEWVLRSIEKFPDNLLPQSMTNTLAADILRDNSTAAFPYAPLTVPAFSDALGIPHSKPKIVYIAADKNLGIYSKDFANTIALFEEREPLGKSVSTIKMTDKLKDDNDNTVDQHAFLNARLLDIFLGDWDRHGDQWRWVDEDNGKGKTYKPVPRDRDQVFYVNQGFFPKIASLPWIMPKFQGFGGRIKNINTFSFNARGIDGIFTNDLSYDDWLKHTEKTVNNLSDTVIEAALKKLPPNVYAASHQQLAEQLKSRRADMLVKMPRYYRFLNKVIDIPASNKNELVTISDTLSGQMGINIYKISKNDQPGKLLYSRVLDPSVTKEIRLFLQGGNDSVSIKNTRSPIRIRVVGDGVSPKKYDINGNNKYLRKIHVYDGTANAFIAGSANRVHRHFSEDKTNTELQLTNRYNKTIPLLNAGFNVDDGLIFGAGIKFIQQGFRKQPYASMQQFTLAHSFSTNAYRIIYKGEWLQAVGRADFLLQASALAPDNTQNFFGRGNQSVIDKTGDYRRYYRTRFSLFNLAPAFRWRTGKGNSVTLGPSLQYYRYDASDNKGRFITNTSLIHSYDSTTIANDKTHAGIIINLLHDTRNSILLPTFGSYINMRVQGYAGLNTYSKSFAQCIAELAVYKSIDRKSAIVIANRVGGGVTTGRAAFYQSLFLGGHENLRGYNQYRFAGEQMLYNNLEVRIKLANLASYILPGQLGIIGFYDAGKVWQKGYNSDEWHQGAGGGIYFAPAQIAVFQLVAGNSGEGWYPYFTMGLRF
ncbi:MAG: BamA/TamA family outer membrane protein [Ferruginibacter sp.]|nr:BamA/TamA family outer membrane protein [Ferruginibacter sp.]